MRTFNIISAYLSKIPYRLKCSFMKFYNLGLIFSKKKEKKTLPKLIWSEYYSKRIPHYTTSFLRRGSCTS